MAKWEAVPWEKEDGVSLLFDGRVVAGVEGVVTAHEMARKLNASDAMLVALKLLREDHSIMEPHHEDMCPTCKVADAAIAEAEGTGVNANEVIRKLNEYEKISTDNQRMRDLLKTASHFLKADGYDYIPSIIESFLMEGK